MERQFIPKNLMFICLSNKNRENYARSVANEIGLMYLNSRDMISYDLIEEEKVREISNVDYLVKREKRVMRRISSYENVLIDIDYDLFTNNFEYFINNSLKVYLRISKEDLSNDDDIIDKISYDSRNEFLSENCDVVIDLVGTYEENLQKIYEVLGGNL